MRPLYLGMATTKRVFLIGFMGAGKSTIGKRLANHLGLPFVDLDTVIEQQAGQTVSEIFESRGEAVFRQLESQFLGQLCSSTLPGVFALGGGTPCSHENIELITRSGCAVYLEMGAGVLSSRLAGAQKKRPLIAGKSPEELQAFVVEKLEEREPFYAQAHIVFDARDVSSERLEGLAADVAAHYTSTT